MTIYEQPGRYTVSIQCVFSSIIFRVGGLISWSHLYMQQLLLILVEVSVKVASWFTQTAETELSPFYLF